MTVARRLGAVALSLSMAVVAGCTVKFQSYTPSQTPRITQAPMSPDEAARFLTTADLLSVPNLPPDMAVISVNDVTAYVNPDPRGSCGAKLDQPSGGKKHLVALQSSVETGSELIAQATVAQATDFMSSLIADSRVGCPGFDSVTNAGSTQHVHLDQLVDTGVLGDQRLAALFTITNDAQTAHGAQIAVRVGDRLLVLAVFGPAPIAEQTVQAFADRATARLAGG